ncbi:MAG TPA: hypothetical protein DCX07_08500 [Phycisphaerales bacterium]|nr:hypothetical protein [Phycisphaerales bacterium]
MELLTRWAQAAEQFWYPIPGRADLGCYGTGYNAWGVQTNQKYLSALAVLAAERNPPPGLGRQWALDRALAALRFSLASHVSGSLTCTDGTQWGNTWISALGVERMMHGVDAIEAHLTDADRNDLRRVLTSEADWLLTSHRKGSHQGVFGDVWNSSGKNVPESNLWNGCLLWRAAVACPEHPRAADWREQAHRFLLNSVSVPADASDETVLAGKAVKDRFAGANFFPHYALDHHGYLNVGYMVICVSNAAMLHFGLKTKGLPRPDTLDHHEANLWNVLRRMLFSDGRLARIGGDTRVRYAYCQEYLLPSLFYAADRLGDAHAMDLAGKLLELFDRESGFNGDGTFFGRRLADLREQSPYYYTRLESDRACVLSQAIAFAPLTEALPRPREDFESSVAGYWVEPEHGAVMHRSRTRLASFAWRAQGLTQGLCLPPGESSLAEWRQNLCGQVTFLGDQTDLGAACPPERRLVRHDIQTFPGGFLTAGAVVEGDKLTLPEGWQGSDSAMHQIVFAALPDDRTVLGLQHCRAGNRRAYLAEVKGLRLNVPNDLYNDFRRTLTTTNGRTVLESPAPTNEVMDLDSRWVSVDGRLGAVTLYGAASLHVSRSRQRRGGKYRSLHVEEICAPCRVGTHEAAAGEVILDCAWAVLSGADAQTTAEFAERNSTAAIPNLPADVRGLRVCVSDGRWYVLLANFGERPASVPAGSLTPAGPLMDMRGKPVTGPVTIPPGQAVFFER